MINQAAWIPDKESMKEFRLHKFMSKLGYSDYDAFYSKSVADISWYWGEVLKDLDIRWDTPYRNELDLSEGKAWPKWFVDGELNIVSNALDKWLEKEETAKQSALVWEGEDGELRRFSYSELAHRVNLVVGGLQSIGLRRGDRVAIYMPMIPETVIAMLAVAKMGAILTLLFSGYGVDAVRKRLEASQAKLLITADGYLRRGQHAPMKEIADRAVEGLDSVEHLVVVRRLNREIPWQDDRDIDWKQLEQGKGSSQTLPLPSDTPFMLIYTSGTTGKPKGTVHTHAGFPIKAASDAAYGLDIRQGDVVGWITDMGWMMGPFLVFATLLNGATMVLYEGVPDYPTTSRLWQLVERHKITHLGISPTLIRTLMKHGEAPLQGIDLSSLRVIGSTGEPWNPEPWMWLFETVGKRKVPIFNYSGGTEVSGGILGNVLVKPLQPITFNSPLPGIDADVFDPSGHPVRGEVGELVVRQPWVGMTNGFWEERERYEETYWNRWPGIWVHGDWVYLDDQGYWTIEGRSDDTMNIAGKRVGPIEFESVLVGHPTIIEAAAVGIPDNIKGEAAVCFATVRDNAETGESLQKELIKLLDDNLGKALRPKNIYFVKDLPKTRNAKIMRRVIRSAYLNLDMGDNSALENPEAVNEILALGKKFTG